jgi:hypothetical protein
MTPPKVTNPTVMNTKDNEVAATISKSQKNDYKND